MNEGMNGFLAPMKLANSARKSEMVKQSAARMRSWDRLPPLVEFVNKLNGNLRV